MPEQPNVHDTSSRRQQHRHGRKGRGQGREGRRAVAIPIPPTAQSSILSPLLSNIKGFLPASPVPGSSSPHGGRKRGISHSGDNEGGLVQRADLGDGLGRRPLLVQWNTPAAVQIFSLPFASDIGSSLKPVSTVAPIEVFCLSQIGDCPDEGRLFLKGVSASSAPASKQNVIHAQVVQRNDGPVLALITSSVEALKKPGALALVIVRLSDGQTLSCLELGRAPAAKIAVSRRVLIVALSTPRAAIHILDLDTLLPTHSPLLDLPVDPRTGMPVFALSDRMLAFTTTIPSIHFGPGGLGFIVTSATFHPPTRAPMVVASNPQSPPRQPQTTQEVLLSSAAGIGSGVARGVLAGLKLGAKAASSAQGRLARSAPSDGYGRLWRSASGETPVITPDPLDVEAAADGVEDGELPEAQSERDMLTLSAGRWVVVLDLFPRGGFNLTASISTDSSSERSLVVPNTLAHFALPHSTLSISPMTHAAVGSNASVGSPRNANNGLLQQNRSPRYLDGSGQTRRGTATPSVSYLSFAPNGLSLFVAPASGRVFHVFELRPSPSGLASMAGDGTSWNRGLADVPNGEVWERYQLKRGLTSAAVTSVEWGAGGGEGQWIGVGTSKGTIHVFPVRQSGGQATPSTHVTLARSNVDELQPLSVAVQAVVRLRTGLGREAESTDDLEALSIVDSSEMSRAPVFGFLSAVPGEQGGSSQQDMVVYRPGEGVLDLARLDIKARSRESTPVHSPPKPRGSGLTEMMKDRGLLAREGALAGDYRNIGRWSTQLGGEVSPVFVTSAGEIKRVTCPPASPINYLSQAEIQTHSTSRRILPTSIYLNKQVEFYAAIPTDGYSPLSVIDPAARVRRLTFRPDIEVRPISPDVASFDEPLSTALHTIIDARPSTLIPGLPNGQPSRTTWRKAIPIRHVAAGLGEGVGRVRREIARVQHTRQRRRASEAAGNSLSFDEEAVFPPGVEAGARMLLDDGSSPGSMIMPHAERTESSLGADERSDEWDEGWEEEYQKAVEEDGPDDLILGLLDEEEEERRKWEQKHVARKLSPSAGTKRSRPQPRPDESVAILATSDGSLAKETHIAG